MKLTRIRRNKNLSEVVSEQIVSQLTSGALRPGDRLPTEPELCASLGVGRTSLREGLRPLVLLGLLDVRPGDGTYVAEDSSEFFAKPLTWGVLIGEQNITQLVEARELIELGTAGLAAQRGLDQDMARLAALLEEMGALIDDPETFMDRDMAFHALVAEMSGNVVLARLTLGLIGLLRPWSVRMAHTPGYTRISLEGHRDLLQGVQSRDPAQARAAMERHVRGWAGDIARYLLTPRGSQ